ncbi:hypothetical protein HELRODRAFT_180051 [Helobdella robusta]|uniref:Alpha-macroglobulin receptor-binding domain-containing protein n=1 Tax=Helobdella robusta TaxID=6412 RepID=T1FFE5_HELRO|nr:hypothetical protein HELRODRAFT_180051 [Helobdella robusta]ESN94944.1 hypothetical protein HELRODRAFT_180051 [Helobdella robusta]
MTGRSARLAIRINLEAYGTKINSALSSFVIKCFHQAKEYIPVEDSKIAATMDWIIGLQADNGTFAEPPEGRVIHTDMQGGSSAGVAMTAYVLIALLENKNVTLSDTSKLSDAITNATTFLENNMELYSKDPYALAIISYAFFKSGSDKLAETLSLLESLAVNEGGLTYWHKASESSSDNIWRGPYSQAKSYSIEIASYALMVYAQKKDLDKALPIGKWLLKQRNAFGGFSSTQDTVLALEALASFAPLIVPASDGAGVVVSVTAGGGNSFTHQFNAINKHNALFLQSVQLPESTTSVKVHAVGEGVALAQLIVKYNVDNENSNQFLSLNLSTTSVDKKLKLSLSTAWSGSEVTGMVVVEINILTGYSLLDDGNFIQQIGSTFKKVEKSSNKVVIYLDELTYEFVHFDVHLDEVLNIANVKPALVKVYRYYRPDSSVTGFYSSSSGQTWEGACPQCCR